MIHWTKILYITFLLVQVERVCLLCNAQGHLDEVGCDGEKNCLCFKDLRTVPSKGIKSKLICDNEIKISSRISYIWIDTQDTPIVLDPKFKELNVVCNPVTNPDILLKDYYNLLNMRNIWMERVEYIILNVSSCPPMPYWTFIYPQGSPFQNNTQFHEPIRLLLACKDFGGNFTLQRMDLYGLQNLKQLEINCHKMTDLSSDIFNHTFPLLSSIIIKSTLIRSVYANTFSNLSHLRKLKMSNNSLTNILVDAFNNLRSLIILDLSHNSIAELGDGIFKDFDVLKHLNLSYNNLIFLPRSIGNLSKLEQLDLTYNSLVDISPIEGLNNLEILNAGFNLLININRSTMISWRNVDFISFTGNALINIEKIPSTMSFDFSGNKLHSIPEDMFQDSDLLYEVILRNNSISDLLPNTFINNSYLLNLDLSSNRISSLHDDIFVKNHELSSLDISNNQLTSLPIALFNNKSLLTVLNAADNQLISIDSSIFTKSRSISRLDLSGNLLEQIPKEIFAPIKDNLFHLKLDRNNILSIPFLQLPHVRYFNLSHNHLEYIPEGLFQNFSALKTLDLSNNHIKNISNSPLLPEKLQMSLLDLSNNHLSDIPRDIFHNVDISIESINFSYNTLMNLDLRIVFWFKNLRELHLSDNNLKYFGENVSLLCYLPRDLGENPPDTIIVLDLSNNNLEFKEAKLYYDDKRSLWGRIAFPNCFPNLEVLLLSNNSISTILLDWRSNFPKLRLLDLRYNKILHLHHQDLIFPTISAIYPLPIIDDFDKIIQLRRMYTEPPCLYLPPLIVDLRWNLIKSVNIPPSKIKNIFLERDGRIPSGVYGHATILLDDNPFLCDCSVIKFLRIVQNDVAPITGNDKTLPARIEVGNLSCWDPNSIRGSIISEPETWTYHLLPLISLCSL